MRVFQSITEQVYIRMTQNLMLDFRSTSGTLNFTPGSTKSKFEISIINDTEREKNETFLITLSNLVGSAVFSGQC